MDKYLQKVIINADLYDSVDGMYRKGCCHLNIKDRETGNTATYYRSPNGFSFKLIYELGEENKLSVTHFFSDQHSDKDKIGETIFISTYGDNVDNEIDIRLNVTNGKIGTTFGEMHQATPDEITSVSEKLVEATKLAKKITDRKLSVERKKIK